MAHTFWHKQTAADPLFPNMLWNRPENRLHAGKLLIAGGNLHGFNAPAEAFGEAGKAGIGTVRVLLPDALSKTISKVFPEAEFAPSTPSGSFARHSLSEFMDISAWADGVLLAGSFGKNSETAVLLESYVQEYEELLTLAGDSVDFFLTNPAAILQRPQTTLVLEFSQLQKLGQEAKFTAPFTSEMDLMHMVEALHEFTESYHANIITVFAENVLVASAGQVSTTKSPYWSAPKTAARASVWSLQNPTKPFEALTTSIV